MAERAADQQDLVGLSPRPDRSRSWKATGREKYSTPIPSSDSGEIFSNSASRRMVSSLMTSPFS